MKAPLLPTEHLELSGIGSYFRPRDAEAIGVNYDHLRGLVARGVVQPVARGLYRQKAAEPTQLDTLALVSARIPEGIVCLLSALQYHDIGTQLPRDVWIALDRRARRPCLAGLPVSLVRFSGSMLHHGVVECSFPGVSARITTPARTLVDCFRYRRKLGMDVALEALHDVVNRRPAPVDEILRAAEVCRIRTVITPYLEAVLS